MKKKIYLTIESNKGKIGLYIKTPVELENYFQKASENKKKTSDFWKDKEGESIKFYSQSEDYTNKIESLLGYNYFDSFGNGLYQGSKINIAPLRAVGASRGVQIYSERFDNLVNLDFENYTRGLSTATKKLFENIFTKKTLKAVITIEF